MRTSPTGRSWSGTVGYGPGTLYAPKDLDELQALVAGSRRIRALGTRHSFSEIGATGGDLVTLADLPPTIEIDAAARTVRVAAGVRYGELVVALWEAGLALGNMGSLPHISVAGASATGTHGSGDTNQVLAASVRAVELVTAGGDLVTVQRPDAGGTSGEDWGGMVLSLGLLGVATHLTLDVVPAFRVRQAVYLDMPEQSMDAAGLDAALGGAYSVSLFHHWDGHVAQAWVKQKVTGGGDGATEASGAGAAGAGGAGIVADAGDLVRCPSGGGSRPPAAGDARGLLHRPDRHARPVLRTPPALPARVHPVQRRGDPVRVLRGPRADRGGARGGHAAR